MTKLLNIPMTNVIGLTDRLEILEAEISMPRIERVEESSTFNIMPISIKMQDLPRELINRIVELEEQVATRAPANSIDALSRAFQDLSKKVEELKNMSDNETVTSTLLDIESRLLDI